MPPKQKKTKPPCIRPEDPTPYKWISDHLITCPGGKENEINYEGWLKPIICREGTKKDLLRCLFPLFPQGNEAPDLFVDLFMGSGVVSLNYANGLKVPPDGKGYKKVAKKNHIEVKAKEGCEIWANDLSTIIPMTYKAFKGKDEAFIDRVVKLGKELEGKTHFPVGSSKAIGKLSLQEFENKRSLYALNRVNFGNTPRPKDGGLMAMKGKHEIPQTKGGNDEDTWNNFKKEWEGQDKPNYGPANKWMDAKVAKKLLDRGLIDAKDVARRDGEIVGVKGIFKSWIGTPLEEEGLLTERGLINVLAATCGSTNSSGFGYAYKYVPPKKADLVKAQKTIQRITYFNEPYIEILRKVEAWHKQNPTKKIFIFADPPYPEGLHYETKGENTYGEPFNNAKLAANLRVLAKLTKGQVKIMVTNGYEPWLGNYLKWQRDRAGKPFWNIYRLTVGARGGERLKDREELLYTNYNMTIVGPENKKVPESRFSPDYSLGATAEPEGVFKCMPPDEEWEYIKRKVEQKARHFIP